MNAVRSADELVSGVGKLAVLPAVYERVRQVIDDPDSSAAELAKLLSTDAVITARLLHVVNSVYFGLMSRVETVSRAVSMLGMRQVHDIVLATSIANVFAGVSPGGMDMTRYWSDSVMRALVARVGAEMARAGELERFFVAGLLADLGHLVMYQAEPERTEQARLRADREGLPLDVVEREMIGCDFAQVGAALVAKWLLPDRLRDAIAGQIDPLSAPEAARRDAAFLCLARIMTPAFGQQLDSDTVAALVAPGVWSLTGLKPANVGAIRAIAEMNHAEVVALFFPNRR